ncbi:MAG: hypothetical protein PHC51_10005 [bacterium]|nr:hypothetical protein [bacterium]
MHRTAYFCLLLSLSLHASYIAAEPPRSNTALSDADLHRYQYCGNDKDCVVMRNGCCDCANGGFDVAINKMRVEDFKARFNCMSTTCTEIAPVTPCGIGTVTCVEHRCDFVSENDFLEKGAELSQ